MRQLWPAASGSSAAMGAKSSSVRSTSTSPGFCSEAQRCRCATNQPDVARFVKVTVVIEAAASPDVRKSEERRRRIATIHRRAHNRIHGEAEVAAEVTGAAPVLVDPVLAVRVACIHGGQHQVDARSTRPPP